MHGSPGAGGGASDPPFLPRFGGGWPRAVAYAARPLLFESEPKTTTGEDASSRARATASRRSRYRLENTSEEPCNGAQPDDSIESRRPQPRRPGDGHPGIRRAAEDEDDHRDPAGNRDAGQARNPDRHPDLVRRGSGPRDGPEGLRQPGFPARRAGLSEQHPDRVDVRDAQGDPRVRAGQHDRAALREPHGLEGALAHAEHGQRLHDDRGSSSKTSRW